METVVDQLRAWQALGGPALWEQAWDRTLRVVEQPLNGYGINIDGVVIAEGAAGLTTAYYIVAAERGVTPDAVPTEEVEALFTTGPSTEDLRADWEGRLNALGHDLTDHSDPVARLWSVISHNHRTPPGNYDDTEDASMTRWGPGYLAGLHKLRSRFAVTI